MATLSNNLQVRVSGRDDLTPELDRIESRLIRFVGAVGAGIAAIRVGTAPIAAAITLEREMANVAKTTNFSRQEISLLNKELLAMSTRVDVTALDLAKIAAAAGQQGLGREGVEGIVAFTESVSRMASVLDLTADDAAKSIGKIINIFKIPLREVERAVSIFNEVSNNSTAEGEELLDVVKRIGDAAGNLNLEQVAALSATGLDFGQSPEVVGTAFAKVFTSLTQKAEQFGELMRVSGTDWITRMETDGLTAFRDVLARLRELGASDQQNTIVKLFGGGRIGALINKLVQDTTDAVLLRNFDSAQRGALGLSAINEQMTVLNTLKAQGTLTFNTLTKLGIESTEQLLAPLTRYVIELREVLESPKMRAFMSSLAAGLGTVAEGVVGAAKAVASLKINWENLLPVAGAFLGLKAAESFARIAGRVLNLSDALQTFSTTTSQSTAALAANTAASNAAGAAATQQAQRTRAAAIAERLGLTQVYEAVQRNRAARLENLRVSEEIARRQAGLAAAEANTEQARAAARGSFGLLRDRSSEVQAQRDRVSQAIQAAAQAEQNVQAQRQARLLAAEQAHNARMVAIETSYQTRRRAIVATGTQVGMKALRDERAAQIAAEEATYARSIRSTESYWARRIQAAREGAAATVAAERAAYMQVVGRFDERVSNDQSRRRDLTAAQGREDRQRNDLNVLMNSAAGINAANAAVQQHAGLVGVATSVYGGLTTAVGVARVALSSLITVVGRVAAAFLPILGWGTLIYSLLDMAGVIDLLGPKFQALTDAIGLTSAAKRESALADKAKKEAMIEEGKQLDSLAEKYRNLANAADPDNVKRNVESLVKTATTSDSQENRSNAMEDLFKILEGNKVTIEQQSKLYREKVTDELASVTAAAATAEARIAELQAQRVSALSKLDTGSNAYKTTDDRFKAQIQAATQAFAALDERMRELTRSAPKVSTALNEAGKDSAILKEQIGSMFTPQSAELLRKYGLEITGANDKIRQLTEEYKKLQATSITGSESDKQAASDRMESIKKEVGELYAQSKALDAEMRNAVQQAAKVPGITEQIRKSLTDIPAWATLSQQRLVQLLSLLSEVDDAQKTGKNAGYNAVGPSSGTDTFNPSTTGKESLARRLARAEIEFAKANNSARAKLAEEGNRQLLEEEEFAYARGLRSITDYYEERQRIQLEGVEEEIRRLQLDRKAIETERGKGKVDAAEQKRFEAQIAQVNGEIAVLQARKDGIRASTRRDISQAQESFNLTVLRETEKLMESGIISTDAATMFSSILDRMRREYEDTARKMGKEGRAALAESQDEQLKVDAANEVLKNFDTRALQTFSKVRQLKEEWQRSNQQGLLTSAETERAFDAAISSALPSLEGMVSEQEKILASMEGIKGSPAYNEMALKVAAARAQVAALRGEMDQTAQNVNRGMVDALTNSLSNMKLSFSGLKDAALDFLQTVGNQVKQIFARNLAEEMMRSLGNVGSGGFGGFISSLLKPTAKNDGSSVATPLYVSDVKNVKEGLAEPLQATAEGVTNLPGKIGGFFLNLGGTISGLIQTVIGFLGSAFASLIAAIFTSNATAEGAGFLGDVIGAAGSAMVAHTGGIIGSSRLATRMVAPGMFQNAPRYHTGGVLGLKPNEVPIIGLKGEEMLTEDDPRHRNNLGKSGAGGSSTPLNIWIVTPDQQPSVGPQDIVTVVSDNISRGGSIKKLIQQVNLGR